MVGVLCKDDALARMLTLAVRQEGFDLSTPEEAQILLFDLGLPMPPCENKIVIGLAAEHTRITAKESFFAILPLPFSAVALHQVLLDALRALPPRAAISLQKRQVRFGGRTVRLGDTEQKILSLLLQNRGQVVPNARLQALFSKESADSNTLQVYIYRLRRKLCSDGTLRIAAVRGQGYYLA